MTFLVIEDMPKVLHSICVGIAEKRKEINTSRIIAIKCKPLIGHKQQSEYRELCKWVSECENLRKVILLENEKALETLSLDILDGEDLEQLHLAIDVALFGEPEGDYSNFASVKFAKKLEDEKIIKNCNVIFYTLYAQDELRKQFVEKTDARWGQPIRRPNFYHLRDTTEKSETFFRCIFEGRKKFVSTTNRWI